MFQIGEEVFLAGRVLGVEGARVRVRVLVETLAYVDHVVDVEVEEGLVVRELGKVGA